MNESANIFVGFIVVKFVILVGEFETDEMRFCWVYMTGGGNCGFWYNELFGWFVDLLSVGYDFWITEGLNDYNF